jgi:glycosyltransferase involved in cell wall biosynthesis
MTSIGSCSVSICTYNRAAALPETISAALAQDVGVPVEVLLVDNASTDGTPEVARRFPVRYVREPRQGLARARNAALRHATGDLIAFVDDDATPRPGWLAALVQVYRDCPDAWCVGGKISLQLPESIPSWFDPRRRDFTAALSALDLGAGVRRVPYPESVWGANWSVSREAVRAAGPFLEWLGPIGRQRLLGEETEYCWRIQRLGGEVYYTGAAEVIHRIPPTRLTKQYYRDLVYWLGRTSVIYPEHPTPVSPEPVSWWSTRIAKNLVKALALPGSVDASKAFTDSFHLWFHWGRLHEYMRRGLGTVAPRRRAAAR